jgi:hypothetical protein
MVQNQKLIMKQQREHLLMHQLVEEGRKKMQQK